MERIPDCTISIYDALPFAVCEHVSRLQNWMVFLAAKSGSQNPNRQWQNIIRQWLQLRENLHNLFGISVTSLNQYVQFGGKAKLLKQPVCTQHAHVNQKAISGASPRSKLRGRKAVIFTNADTCGDASDYMAVD